MAEHTTIGAPPDKLSAVVFSGTFEKVHYALVMAASAAAIGRPATLFFTMDAIRALLADGDDQQPSWRRLPSEQGQVDGGNVDDGFGARGVATFEELLLSCVELGVKFMVCEMGLRAIDIERSALRDDVPVEEGGVVTFLNDASSGGAMLFI
jgi:peroxiredoxin family protein